MAAYLQTHKQKLAQIGYTRRNGARPSGVVVLHTAENTLDLTGADTGAEAVARFITSRTNYGSYHVLVDADSTIQMAPWSAECWHDTATNNHSVGISAAVQAGKWLSIPKARREAIVKRMAAAAADYAAWLKQTRGITIPAKRITQAQSRKLVPGFLGHGESDPGRRSDPGKDFDWDLFFTEYRRLTGQKAGIVATVAAAVKKAVAKKYTTVRRGSVSKTVGKVQAALVRQGYTKQIVDNIYGPQTDANVRDYQRRVGLVIDGIAGPITQRKLGL